MSRFNKATAAPPKTTGLITTAAPATTALGGSGFVYDTVSQLILLAANNLVSQDTFHEKAAERDDRFIQLAESMANSDPALVVKMLPWMRAQMRMRTSSIMAAAHVARIITAAPARGQTTSQATARMVVANTLQRADEPGEFLAYWISTFGRKIPHGVKRGVGDAILRLYNQRAALKYNANMTGRWSMGDIIAFCGRRPDSTEQLRLFEYLVTVAKGRPEVAVPPELTMIHANQQLRAQVAKTPDALLNPTRLSMAGMNWENAVPLAVEYGLSRKAIWSSMIPSMNVMALLRNLRNFDEAGITDLAAQAAVNKILNPLDVMRSKVLPMRIWSAYRTAVSDRWKWPLQQAMDVALTNVPTLPGRTLILVDTSGSMNHRLSDKSDLLRWDAAVLFGLAVARKCDAADVVSFSTFTKLFPAKAGETLLQGMERWRAGGFNLNHGTSTAAAVRQHFDRHDRIIILTDEQASDGNVFAGVPGMTMCVTFNLAGHRVGHAPAGSPRRVTIGGLSDAAFSLLPALEGVGRGVWPWDATDQWGEV